MKLTRTTTLLIAAGLNGLVGCATDKSTARDFFPPDDGNRKTQQFANVQAARGAAEDPTLQAHHFDGAKLNSLGEQKLALLLPDEHDAEVTVYVNIPESADTTSARRTAVTDYFVEQGMESEKVKVELGVSPGTGTPAASGLANLSKTETGKAGGESSTAEKLGEGFMEMVKDN